MKTNKIGWLNYIIMVVIICTSCQIFASDFSPQCDAESDVTSLSHRNELTHFEALDDIRKDSVLVGKLNSISTDLFFPVTMGVNRNDCDKLQNNRDQYRNLVRNLEDEKELQNVSWQQFHNDFIINKTMIGGYMADPKIQSQITHPLFGEKFNNLLKRDINKISLNDFCDYIIEFDYILRKAFLTKPPQEDTLTCEKCGEQEIECTKFIGQPMLECNFCGYSQYLFGSH